MHRSQREQTRILRPIAALSRPSTGDVRSSARAPHSLHCDCPPCPATSSPPILVATLFQPRFDTEACGWMAELLAQRVEVDSLRPDDHDMSLGTDAWLAALPVQRVAERSDAAAVRRARRGAPGRRGRLRRAGPPQGPAAGPAASPRSPDRSCRSTSRAEVLRHSEHLLPVRFPEHAIPTAHLAPISAALRDAVRAQPGEAVVKPMGECSGTWASASSFSPWTRRPGPVPSGLAGANSCWCAVSGRRPATRGDLRILTIGHHILGSVTRLPRAGSRLANLHQGASFHAFELTAPASRPSPPSPRSWCRAALPARPRLHRRPVVGDQLHQSVGDGPGRRGHAQAPRGRARRRDRGAAPQPPPAPERHERARQSCVDPRASSTAR